MMNVCETDRREAREAIISMRGGVVTEADLLAMNSCLNHASNVWLCSIDEEPVAAWGLVPPTILADRAYLWLYVTPAIEGHGSMYKFLFVRRSQVVMETMRNLYPTIYGVCQVGDARAIRWVRWLGGVFGYPMGNQVPFVIEATHG